MVPTTPRSLPCTRSWQPLLLGDTAVPSRAGVCSTAPGAALPGTPCAPPSAGQGPTYTAVGEKPGAWGTRGHCPTSPPFCRRPSACHHPVLTLCGVWIHLWQPWRTSLLAGITCLPAARPHCPDHRKSPFKQRHSPWAPEVFLKEPLIPSLSSSLAHQSGAVPH